MTDELAEAAKARLPRAVWDFAAGGAGAERTLAANRAAFDRVALVPRVLTGSVPDPATRLLGTGMTMPVAVAPVAYLRMYHPDGDLAVAAAARRAGIPFTAAMLGSHTIEEIRPDWFQLYWPRDRGLMLDLVRRAERAGCSALMVTVDMPVMARRDRDVRNRFTLPDGVTAANLVPDGRAREGSTVVAHTNTLFDPAVSWADLDWLRSRTALPIALKGVLDPRDAARAVAAGVDAVVVSNHGGRQLDGAVPAVDALPGVREAVGEHSQVLLDSGVRSGLDVVRALALGADGVLIGRPLVWALSVGGTDGAAHVLRSLRDELCEVLALTGCGTVGDARELATARM
ncbi:alpha-hydroxy-acid oxidizing enzyme [Actinoplanes italicus]|uniref:4-hydroxymandelate oxidase n=1 Tax=Actinoplanes italicus TaxID=113567 RepID=A0A2T0K8L1_9ACTN|nr:alpha-hydroxy acid oxidase [Actinoplanes italicus]PRX19415.1 4-hydroxymandelate oxidase [Actinoplanes italicus]GIE30570.1 alpha-hydroxy-acid oxidizing enzyme [Actinoplanes italicus]